MCLTEPLLAVVGNDAGLRRNHAHKARALGPENKAHHVYAKRSHFANILGIAHATYLDYHILKELRSYGVKELGEGVMELSEGVMELRAAVKSAKARPGSG